MDMKIPAFSLVMFGGTGDLAMRKLLPALYQSFLDGAFGEASRVVCAARTVYDHDGYRAWMNEAVRPNVSDRFDEAKWQAFLQKVFYLPFNANDEQSFAQLKTTLDGLDTGNQRVFYLAVAPSIFETICEGLSRHGLHQGARIVVEKPLGHDLASCIEINDVFAQHFQEEQIFRIDHYLGKEAVQNLMALRFGNSFFEPILRRDYVANVQITIAEELGVERRAEFYDQTGALRDMVQNHLLQLLCFVAMSAPTQMNADSIRDEKLAVLRALKPWTADDIAADVVRGQYGSGVALGKEVHGYRDENGVPTGSNTETYVALKTEINNWRFAGVPFYLRTGKRMPRRMAEIVVVFKAVPYELIGKMPSGSNRLVIELQPEESIKMYCLAKRPGNRMQLGSVHLDMDADDFFPERRMDGYERLLLDALRGDLSLFVRRDEQEQAWRWVEPIIDAWEELKEVPKPYTAGTWGPPAANALVARDGHNWHEEL